MELENGVRKRKRRKPDGLRLNFYPNTYYFISGRVNGTFYRLYLSNENNGLQLKDEGLGLDKILAGDRDRLALGEVSVCHALADQ
jgi:hypothetical protein